MSNKNISKEAIVTEYLENDVTYRELEAKYGYPYSSICHWVLGRKIKSDRPGRKRPRKKNAVQKALPEEVTLLQRALLKTQLHNKLLEEIIRLSEEHTGIELRKKVGTKRS